MGGVGPFHQEVGDHEDRVDQKVGQDQEMEEGGVYQDPRAAMEGILQEDGTRQVGGHGEEVHQTWPPLQQQGFLAQTKSWEEEEEREAAEEVQL